tara:strand:- start:9710 stop:9850 length:141 start_codon:yes stop_codon:yes gene_type:complete
VNFTCATTRYQQLTAEMYGKCDNVLKKKHIPSKAVSKNVKRFHTKI